MSMRRAPIVATATAAGLAGVLAFHTSPQSVKVPSADAAGSQPAPASSSMTPSAASQSSKPASRPSPSPKPRPKPTSPHASSPAATTRTVDGPTVNYSYGTLSVAVTVTGSKIVKVGIASLNDDGNARSQAIDQQAIPVLEREAVQAQSGNIQSVSGASYTSAGFRTSLQAALRTLGVS
jgi:uncharacterized protein with FMN-binding domain